MINVRLTRLYRKIFWSKRRLSREIDKVLQASDLKWQLIEQIYQPNIFLERLTNTPKP